MITASGFMDDGSLEPKGFRLPSSLHGRTEGRDVPKLRYTFSLINDFPRDPIREYVNSELDASLYTNGGEF